MKCASVAIIGRPSSGKSTLINTICESKISITSHVPQTTRNAIRGIYTDRRGQLIFTDTPGWHISEKDFNRRMQEIAVSSLEDCDAVVYVIDATRKAGEEEDAISFMLSGLSVPVVCAVNKKDILSSQQLEDAHRYLRLHVPGRAVFDISAADDDGIDELLIELYSKAPDGELLYDESARTDQNLEFRISEIIREKAINCVRDEIPHSIRVDIADLEYNEEKNRVWIRAFIIVERESQKAILVGKGGATVKSIRVATFKELKSVFPDSVIYVDLRVRVDAKWKTDSITLSKIFKSSFQNS